jgi:membrane associated rhomboid family serine protease
MLLPLHDSQRSTTTPIVTGALIALNVFIFLFQLTLDPFSKNDFVFAFGFIPEHFTLLSIVTSLFLHSGWMHLISNMVFLWIFGDNIEDILGHGKFLFFYLLCGIAAALAQYLVNPDSRVPQIGASGAIFGVMGAYLVKFPHSRILTVGWFIILFSFELPAWVLLVYFIGLQFLSGVGSIADVWTQRGGVAYFAHIGGFFAGMLLILFMRTRDRFALRRDLLW